MIISDLKVDICNKGVFKNLLLSTASPSGWGWEQQCLSPPHYLQLLWADFAPWYQPQSKSKKEDFSLQINPSEARNLIFADMSCGRMKLR